MAEAPTAAPAPGSLNRLFLPASPNTADGEPETIEQIRVRLEGVLRMRFTITDEPTEAAAEPEFCADCRHTGWVRRPVPLHDPDFGKMFPCPACHEPRLRVKRIARAFGAAQIPAEYQDASFAAYAALPGDQAAREILEAIGDGQPVSAFLYGPVGHGKSGLAICLMRAWVEAVVPDALFVTTIDLLDRIRATFSEPSGQDGPSAEDVITAARTAALLVLDDFGRERIQRGERGDWVRERLFAIVNHRHNNRLPTIFTSNLALDDLEAHLGDGGATAWRIKQMCYPNIVRVSGRNLRDLEGDVS